MILSLSTRRRLLKLANFLDRQTLKIRRLVRDTTPKRAKVNPPVLKLGEM